MSEKRKGERAGWYLKNAGRQIGCQIGWGGRIYRSKRLYDGPSVERTD